MRSSVMSRPCKRQQFQTMTEPEVKLKCWKTTLLLVITTWNTWRQIVKLALDRLTEGNWLFKIIFAHGHGHLWGKCIIHCLSPLTKLWLAIWRYEWSSFTLFHLVQVLRVKLCKWTTIYEILSTYTLMYIN